MIASLWVNLQALEPTVDIETQSPALSVWSCAFVSQVAHFYTERLGAYSMWERNSREVVIYFTVSLPLFRHFTVHFKNIVFLLKIIQKI